MHYRKASPLPSCTLGEKQFRTIFHVVVEKGAGGGGGPRERQCCGRDRSRHGWDGPTHGWDEAVPAFIDK